MLLLLYSNNCNQPRARRCGVYACVRRKMQLNILYCLTLEALMSSPGVYVRRRSRRIAPQSSAASERDLSSFA